MTEILTLAGAAFFLAGVVKGIAGMGLPTVALGIMTLWIDPRTAIALILFPMMMTNIAQFFLAGQLLRTVRRFAPFATVLTCGVAVTALATATTPDRILFGALGAVLLLYVSSSWAGWIPAIRPKYDGWAQVSFGLFGGLIGGLTGTWAAAIGIYLSVRQADKDEFIRATGFLISIGSLPLAVSYAFLGFLTGPLSGISFLMIAPAILGMWLGSRLRSRLSPHAFRNAVLLVFVVLALNLIRRSIT